LDFVRLAVVEMRRNSTRITVATVAAALAALTIVLLRFIPQGYAEGVALPQRTYANGDILIFPGPTSLSSSKPLNLGWRAWPGSDWQSHLLDFFPEMPRRGYLTPDTGAGWRGVDLQEVAGKLKGIPNVKRVTAYRSLPCLIQIDGRRYEAVLVGRDLPQSPEDESVYSMDLYVTDGRPLSTEDAGELRALVPGRVRPMAGIRPGDKFQILIPEINVWDAHEVATSPGVSDVGEEHEGLALPSIGVSWDGAKTYSLTCVGKYGIKIGELSLTETSDSGDAPSGPRVIPIYWDRPEIVVPSKTFAEIAGVKSLGTLPTYQVAVKVERLSLLRETTKNVRDALGADYGVYSVPELVVFEAKDRNQVVMSPDLHSVFTVLIIGLSSAVVSGNIYILVVQQRKKIGLLRVVGATSKNVMAYVLSLVGYVSVTGTAIGYVSGKIIYLLALLGSDMTFGEWLIQALLDLGTVMGLSLSISLVIGTLIAYWASRIPCAEVLSRE